MSEINMFVNTPLEASEILNMGEVLAYPTEAVWGLGCDPMNKDAFYKILKLKQRPIEKGVILLASHISQVEPLFENISQEIQQRIIESWAAKSPSERATTWLLPANNFIPEWIKGNHLSVAVRVTQHPLCREICNQFNNFIVSTSANPAGETPAKNWQEAQAYFANNVHYLNGEIGKCTEPSQIIDAVTGKFIRN